MIRCAEKRVHSGHSHTRQPVGGSEQIPHSALLTCSLQNGQRAGCGEPQAGRAAGPLARQVQMVPLMGHGLTCGRVPAG